MCNYATPKNKDGFVSCLMFLILLPRFLCLAAAFLSLSVPLCHTPSRFLPCHSSSQHPLFPDATNLGEVHTFLPCLSPPPLLLPPHTPFFSQALKQDAGYSFFLSFFLTISINIAFFLFSSYSFFCFSI